MYTYVHISEGHNHIGHNVQSELCTLMYISVRVQAAYGGEVWHDATTIQTSIVRWNPYTYGAILMVLYTLWPNIVMAFLVIADTVMAITV